MGATDPRGILSCCFLLLCTRHARDFDSNRKERASPCKWEGLPYVVAAHPSLKQSFKSVLVFTHPQHPQNFLWMAHSSLTVFEMGRSVPVLKSRFPLPPRLLTCLRLPLGQCPPRTPIHLHVAFPPVRLNAACDLWPSSSRTHPGCVIWHWRNADSPQPRRKQTLLIYAWLLVFFFLFLGIILILVFHLHHINILSPPASENKE